MFTSLIVIEVSRNSPVTPDTAERKKVAIFQEILYGQDDQKVSLKIYQSRLNISAKQKYFYYPVYCSSCKIVVQGERHQQSLAILLIGKLADNFNKNWKFAILEK